MAKLKDLHLVLVRSGLTDWDECGRLTGGVDLPLSEEGRGRIEAALGGLEHTELHVVLSGPDDCSRQTASVLASAAGCKVKVLDDLHDVGLGLWEGLRSVDLEERFPSLYKRWLDDPTAVRPPEGESIAEARARVIGALTRTLKKMRERQPRAGVVLRPLARGIVRCWLEGLPDSRLWAVAGSGREAEWHSVPAAAMSGVEGKLAQPVG